jgi:predicted nucleic-acid-binding Zn-ribbon protein
MQKARFKMKSYSDNDITVFREYKEIYNTKTLLKNIIRIEFETFYNTSQSVKKQAQNNEFYSKGSQTPNVEFNHNKSQKNNI